MNEISKLFQHIGIWCYKLFGKISNPYSKIRDYVYSGWWSSKINSKNCIFKFPLSSFTGFRYFKVSAGCTFGKFSVLSAWSTFNNKKYFPKITIGENCRFGDYLHLTSINEIKIGKNVLTGRWVTISDNSHGFNTFEEMNVAPNKRELHSKGPVIIEDNVWIGDKVTILPGVTIGVGSIIGANSVVTKDIPSFCIAAGNPCKIIRILK